MNEHENIRTEIIKQIAELSKLLGVIPADGTTTVTEPVTQNTIELSEWFCETRNSFLKLAVLIGKALDIHFQ